MTGLLTIISSILTGAGQGFQQIISQPDNASSNNILSTLLLVEQYKNHTGCSSTLTHFYTSHSYQLSSPNLLNNIIYSWYLITFFFLLSAAALHLGLEKQGSAASKGIILLSSVSGAAFLSGNRYLLAAPWYISYNTI